MFVSEIRSVNNTVGTYLVEILLARTIGYNLFGSKEVTLTKCMRLLLRNVSQDPSHGSYRTTIVRDTKQQRLK